MKVGGGRISEPWKGKEGRWYSQRKEFIVLWATEVREGSDGIVNVKSSLSYEPWKWEEGGGILNIKQFIVL